MYTGESNVGLYRCFLYSKVQLILNAEMPIISYFRDIFSNTSNTFGPNCQISVLDAGSRLLSLSVVTVNCSSAPALLQMKFSLSSLRQLYHKSPSKSYEHSFHSFFLQVQREQTERLGSGDCPPVSFPVNHSKNSMPLSF